MEMAKCLFLVCILCVLVLGVIFSVACGVGSHCHLPQAHLDLLDVAVISYMALSVISCLVSGHFKESVIGYRHFCGTLGHLCGGLVYFWISRHCALSRRLLHFVIAVWSLINVWSFANAFGFNLFGLYDGMTPARAVEAVSCIGHFNTASAFFCLTVPFAAVLYIRSSSCAESVLYGITVLSGALASLSICADGLWYGLLPASAFMLNWSLADHRRHCRMWQVVLLCSVALVAFRLLLSAGLVHRDESESVFLAEHLAGEIMMVVSVLMLAVLGRNPNLRVSSLIRKILPAGILVTFVAVLIYTFILGFTDPHFGTVRGAVWKGSVWAYRLYSPVEKIFGMGNGSFLDKLSVAVNLLLDRPHSKVAYITCHNSLLQALLAQGVLGLMTLLAGIFSIFRKAARYCVFGKSGIAFPAFISIVAYIGQSMVTSSYTLPVMMLFVMLALYRGCLSKEVE